LNRFLLMNANLLHHVQWETFPGEASSAETFLQSESNSIALLTAFRSKNLRRSLMMCHQMPNQISSRDQHRLRIVLWVKSDSQARICPSPFQQTSSSWMSIDQSFQGCCRGGSRSRSILLTRCYPFRGLISIAELCSLFSKESYSIPLLIRARFVFWGNQVFRQSLPYTIYTIVYILWLTIMVFSIWRHLQIGSIIRDEAANGFVSSVLHIACIIICYFSFTLSSLTRHVHPLDLRKWH
jgi:hypothetical protein